MTIDELLELPPGGMPQRAKVDPLGEYLFLMTCRLLKISDDLCAFTGGFSFPDPLNLVDMGYETVRVAHYWTLWHLSKPEWWTLYVPTWSFMSGPPAFVAAVYQSKFGEEGAVSPFEDVAVDACYIWLADRPVLETFLTVYPLSLEGTGNTGSDWAEASEVVHECHCAAPPTPIDLFYRYWHEASPEDREDFLAVMLTSRERRAAASEGLRDHYWLEAGVPAAILAHLLSDIHETGTSTAER